VASIRHDLDIPALIRAPHLRPHVLQEPQGGAVLPAVMGDLEHSGGGHAVTPYAGEDRGDGSFAVLIYDNNWPSVQREMVFDRNADKWSCTASINPDEAESRY